MTLKAAIEHLVQDLQRFAKSGKAGEKVIAFRTNVLNAVIDGFNALEEKITTQSATLHARIQALENDLAHRDQVIRALQGSTSTDWDWSWLEGRAHTAITYKRKWLGQEEGRSIGPESAKRERRFLDLMERELNTMYDAEIASSLAHSRALYKYNALLGWAIMHGVDLETWHRIPEEHYRYLAISLTDWHRPRVRHLRPHFIGALPQAVAIAMDRLLIDGIVDQHGLPTGRMYRNRGAVALNILEAVVSEEALNTGRAGQLMKELHPGREPAWMWPSALEQENEPVESAA